MDEPGAGLNETETDRLRRLLVEIPAAFRYPARADRPRRRPDRFGLHRDAGPGFRQAPRHGTDPRGARRSGRAPRLSGARVADGGRNCGPQSVRRARRPPGAARRLARRSARARSPRCSAPTAPANRRSVLTMAGVLPATAGGVSCDGVELLGQSPDAVRRQGVALVLEGHPVLNGLSVHDNLAAAGVDAYPARGRPRDRGGARDFPELRKRLSIRGAESVRRAEADGGDRAGADLAAALSADRRIVVRPCAGHRDAGSAETIAAIAQRGVGILLIEQFTTLALGLVKTRLCHGTRRRGASPAVPRNLRRIPKFCTAPIWRRAGCANTVPIYRQRLTG